MPTRNWNCYIFALLSARNWKVAWKYSDFSFESAYFYFYSSWLENAIMRNLSQFWVRHHHGSKRRTYFQNAERVLYASVLLCIWYFECRTLITFQCLLPSNFRMHELSEKLLNFITKDGKCSNLEKMLSNVEDATKLGNGSSVRLSWPSGQVYRVFGMSY